MKVKTRDDEIFEGTPDEIVQYMADSKYQPVRSLAGYRKASAKRVKELFDIDVDPSNSEAFIRTMIEGNVLEDLTG